MPMTMVWVKITSRLVMRSPDIREKNTLRLFSQLLIFFLLIVLVHSVQKLFACYLAATIN